MMMDTEYTEEDLQAAIFAQDIDAEYTSDATADTDTRIRQFYGYTTDEYETVAAFEREIMQPAHERYQRGKAVLRHARVATSDRFDATLPGDAHYEKLRSIAIAPVLRGFCGHAATNQQVHYYTLVRRNR